MILDFTVKKAPKHLDLKQLIVHPDTIVLKEVDYLLRVLLGLIKANPINHHVWHAQQVIFAWKDRHPIPHRFVQLAIIVQ